MSNYHLLLGNVLFIGHAQCFANFVYIGNVVMYETYETQPSVLFCHSSLILSYNSLLSSMRQMTNYLYDLQYHSRFYGTCYYNLMQCISISVNNINIRVYWMLMVKRKLSLLPFLHFEYNLGEEISKIKSTSIP